MHAAREKLLRVVTVAVCLAWLGSFVYLLGGGRYQLFLARDYWGLLVFGAVGFGAFAVAIAVGGLPACHLGRGHGPWVSLAVCLLPLVYLAANPRPMPSSYTLAVRTAFKRMWDSHIALGLARHSPLETGRAAAGLPPATSPAASAPAGADETPAQPTTALKLVLEYPKNVGRRVVTRGMVYRPAGLPENALVVFRFVITCCAADAIPAAVLVASDRPVPFPADTWVEVRGRIERTELKGLDIPIIRAERIVPIRPPQNPYLQ